MNRRVLTLLSWSLLLPNSNGFGASDPVSTLPTDPKGLAGEIDPQIGSDGVGQPNLEKVSNSVPSHGLTFLMPRDQSKFETDKVVFKWRAPAGIEVKQYLLEISGPENLRFVIGTTTFVTRFKKPGTYRAKVSVKESSSMAHSVVPGVVHFKVQRSGVNLITLLIFAVIALIGYRVIDNLVGFPWSKKGKCRTNSDGDESFSRGFQEGLLPGSSGSQAASGAAAVWGSTGECKSDNEQLAPEAPTPPIDRVHFSVTSPASVIAGSTILLDIWAHLDHQRKDVLIRALDEAVGDHVRIKSKGPFPVTRGSILTVRLQVQGFAVDSPEDSILWDGEIGNATFVLDVPSTVAQGAHAARATVRAGGLIIANLSFLIQVENATGSIVSLPLAEKRFETAFACYASDDRDSVLARIQGLQKGVPAMDVFLDVASLRSGDRWQQRLRKEILNRDIFYLFWSEAASKSEWVAWEWRCGLKEKGIEFIDPVPLISPNVVPPPTELADQLHFNDWVLAFMSSSK